MIRRFTHLTLVVTFAALALLSATLTGAAQDSATPTGSDLLLGPTPTAGSLLLGPTPTAGSLLLGPTPTAGVSLPGVSGTTYTSPTYGFTLAWDPIWSVETAASQASIDQLVLTDGASTITLTTLVGPAGGDGDPARCLQSANLQSFAPTGRDFAAATGTNGRPLQGGDASRAYAVYTFQEVPAQGEPRAAVAYLDCRTLVPGSVSLLIVQLTWLDTYNTEVPRLEALLANLVLPPAPLIAPELPTQAPANPTVAAPVATVAPITTAAPVATALPAGCEGMEAWVTATNARVKRVGELVAELNQAPPDVATATSLYYRVAGDLLQLAQEQQATTAPQAAVELNEQLAGLFAAAADGLQRTADAILSTDMTAFQQAQQDLLNVQAEYAKVTAEIVRIAGQCGVKVEG